MRREPPLVAFTVVFKIAAAMVLDIPPPKKDDIAFDTPEGQRKLFKFAFRTASISCRSVTLNESDVVLE